MKVNQLDYLLIWGHGLKYKNKILSLLESNEDFEIIKVLYHIPSNIDSFIKMIYSYDYAPFNHLKAKTKYLKTTPNKVFFIFVNNKNPQIDYLGQGAFRHKESMSLKLLKEKIRNKYNPYENNKRTENHVIHASDNESQTNYILKYLGFTKGLNLFLLNNTILKTPYHLGSLKKFKIKYINIDEIFCSILYGNLNNKVFKKHVQISETPHYKKISLKTKEYDDYLEYFQGYYLTDFYSINKFLKLEKELKYLKPPFDKSYIVVKKIENKYVIQDGVHRACILKKQLNNKILVAVV